MSEHDRYLLIEQAAEILQRTPQTLRNWRCQGQGPKAARVGRRLMYREADVYAFIEAHFEAEAAAAEAKK